MKNFTPNRATLIIPDRHQSTLVVLAAFVLGFSTTLQAEDKSKESDKTGVHLFILSGQSNMAGLQPNESFIPAVEKEFGETNAIVVKDAVGGQPIKRWYKKWKAANGEAPESTGDLYDRLMQKVETATKDRKIETVTFVWMQGERDAREKHGDVYADSLTGLVAQLASDLHRDDINVVIGRLSDFDLKNARYPHWTKIREVQVECAEANPKWAWVDTDDLNDGTNRQGKEIKNDLHYSADGYKRLGQRFADKAIALIRGNKEKLPSKN